MLSETISCRHCGGTRLLNNGHAPNGKLRYFCHDCRRYGRQDAGLGGRTYPEEFRAQVLAAYQERASMRGMRVPPLWHQPQHAFRLAQKKSVS